MTYESDERIAIQQEGCRDADGRPVKIEQVIVDPVDPVEAEKRRREKERCDE